MVKKILFLGGSKQQLPAIEHAKKKGCHVIVCDYLPDNPGRCVSDEYYEVSTTDKFAVLALAEKLNIDGIVAYASDPAAPTAAFVSQEMNLPGNPYDSVCVLTRKDLFRDFLASSGFNSPRAGSYESFEDIDSCIDCFDLPVMVKPVDSSGSKGVVKVSDRSQLRLAVEEALSYSKAARFVVEEFIEKKGYQISGDAFSVDGKLVFSSYGNELYSAKGTRDYVALGEFWPSLLNLKLKQKVDDEVQRIITKLGMKTSAYNVEAILDHEDNVFVLELGPRNGGSYIPQLIRYATGVDLVDYTVRAALGEDCSDLKMVGSSGCYSNYMILSTADGTFRGLWFDPVFEERNLLEVHCTCAVGEQVFAYKNTSHSLGTILFKASSIEEMIRITENITDFCRVVVD